MSAFKKFEAVTGAQPQRSQQQVRLRLLNLVARITNVVSFTADNHVLLGIQKIGNTVPKQRVLFQNDNSCFYRMLSWGGHVCAVRGGWAAFCHPGGANVKQGILPGLFTAENTEDAGSCCPQMESLAVASHPLQPSAPIAQMTQRI